MRKAKSNLERHSYRTVVAIKALATGEASAEQQKAALDWIIYRAAETYEQTFADNADGGDRRTCFNEGKRAVGRLILQAVAMPGAMMEQLRKSDE